MSEKILSFFSDNNLCVDSEYTEPEGSTSFDVDAHRLQINQFLLFILVEQLKQDSK